MIFEVAILDIKPGQGPAFVAALTDAGALETFARMLERPGSVDHLCRLLETPPSTT